MGKIGKPQKKRKNKIKTYGWYKNNDKVNRAPKSFEQEVPRKLRELGAAIKECESGKRNRNKFKNKPDGPDPNRNPQIKSRNKFHSKLKMVNLLGEEEKTSGKSKLRKKREKLTLEVTDKYIQDLKPTRPLLENFNFKQKASETDKQFMKRVDRETEYTLTKSKIADRYSRSDRDNIKSIVNEKIAAERKKKREQKLNEETNEEVSNQPTKEKDKKILDFHLLQDEIVPFGEVAHAPPTLSVIPKKAAAAAKGSGIDRPGLRIPELKEAFSKNSPDAQQIRKKGESVKRKHLSIQQQFESDKKRDLFVEAYRQMKKKRKLN